MKKPTQSAPSRPLYHIFTAVPRRYDLINHIVSWTLDRWWRRLAARECLAGHPRRVLDLGCGTGDLAINLARLADRDVELAGVDYSWPMLELAIKKAKRFVPRRQILFVRGDAADLPFPDGYFDCVGISFAFRNLTYRNPQAARYLAEVRRVLRPDGKFIIVETSQPRRKLIRALFHIYLRWFVFSLGYLFSGNRGAYHYLAESAARFYTPDELRELLISGGFRQVLWRAPFLGVIAIHVALK